MRTMLPRPCGDGASAEGVSGASSHSARVTADWLAGLRRTVAGVLQPGTSTGITGNAASWVAPAFAELRYVRLQQDTGLRQQLGGTLAFRINS
jgi:hypothetical protein